MVYGNWTLSAYFSIHLNCLPPTPEPYINKSGCMGDRKTGGRVATLGGIPTPSHGFLSMFWGNPELASLEPRRSRHEVCGVRSPPAGQERHCQLYPVSFGVCWMVALRVLPTFYTHFVCRI